MRIARGTALNLVGLLAPFPLAWWAIPDLLLQLGPERFTWLSIFWALSAYSGVLDFGVARTLTQRLASEGAKRGAPQGLGALCSTALLLCLLFGLAVMAALMGSASGLITLLRAVHLKGELEPALIALALGVPAMLLGSACRGMLESSLAFGRVNAVRVPAGMLTVIGPWIAISQGGDLVLVAWVLVAIRVVAMLAWFGLAWRALAFWRAHPAPTQQWLVPLLRSGGWLTVGNMVGPLMGYLDRFLVAALLTAAIAAQYVAPQELVTKLWVLPGALMAVLFPAFAAKLTTQAPAIERVETDAMRWVVLMSLPTSFALAMFSKEVIHHWLDSGLVAHAPDVLAVMAWGMFWGCVAQLPFTLLQSDDAASQTAKLHLVQLPVFLLAMWVVVPVAGVVGAAVVWALRCAADAGCLFALCRRRFSRSRASLGPPLLVLAPISAVMFAGAALPTLELRGVWWVVWSVASCWLVDRVFSASRVTHP